MNELSLLTGYGGLSLALRLACPGARAVGYVEREAFAAANLVAKIEAKALDDAPIWPDVTTFDATPLAGLVDIVTAGIPCQPWSCAGKRAGTNDDRWIWSDILRVLLECQAPLAFFEEVGGFVSGGGLSIILGDLHAFGFDAVWHNYFAQEVGAPQKRRERVFILACSRSGGLSVLRKAHDDYWCHASRNHIDGHDEDVACASSSPRWPGVTSEQAQEGSRRGLSPDGGTELANTSSLRPSELEPAWEGGPRRQGESVADPGGLRGQRLGEPGDLGRKSPLEQAQHESLNAPDGQVQGLAPAFPPSFDDLDSWLAYLTERPEAQPWIRRGTDGHPDRVAELRLGGNGVIPAMGALAFLELTARALSKEKE